MNNDKPMIPSVSVKYAHDGRSATADALGMRPMQAKVWLQRGERYLLIKSPPASGKSRALMFVALDKLRHQGLKQAIIVVPEKSIGASFHDEPLSKYGFEADWHVEPRGLLGETPDATPAASDEPDDAELQASLAELEVEGDDVTKLTHVRSHEDRKAAEEIAQRTPCAGFEKFRPTFEKVQQELNAGLRQTEKFHHDGKLEAGDLFILSGQKVLVAGAGEVMMKDFGREDRRLRVIFDNGTESNLLLRSLQRALYKDERNRRILPPDAQAASLFSDAIEEGDLATGYIYVLRSKSNHPFVAEHRSVLHKIGVTGGDVKSRIANAKKDPTYLLADVEIVATFKLANVNRKALEALLHKLFGSARLDLELKDRFGGQVEPREWFLVPLNVIDEALERIKDGTIGEFRYDRESACLVPA